MTHLKSSRWVRIALGGCAGLLVSVAVAAAATKYEKKGDWRATVVAGMADGPAKTVARAMSDFPDDRLALAVVADWLAQDGLSEPGAWQPEAIGKVVENAAPGADKLRAERKKLAGANVPAADPRWAELYLAACEQRRASRLGPQREKVRRVVFTRHYDLGGSHYAYTEGCSDAQAERHFQPGTSLCVLEMDGPYPRIRTLVEDPKGVIRDPDVSYDGKRILFAWKKSDREDDYHLYEMNVDTGQVRQLTRGLGYADYEGAYLPSGDIVFNSSRCMQIVDCWWTEVSNLFVCNADGKYLRQLSFDQVHSNYPTVTDDGRVIYTRWDYNDRGQIFPQGLFQMNQDGTGQSAVYGNNSFFPTSIMHARSIPGTTKVVCVFSGHHTRQHGQLATLDPSKGRQENRGTQLIAPIRDTPAVKVDRYGQSGDQFQYPYPLSQTEFLVTLKPEKSPRFGVYFITIDGERELLASDPKVSCNQPVPLRARPVPPLQPSRVDYRKKTGTVYLQDVYSGPGLEGVERGTIKGLRVVALEFRAAGVGSNSNRGPAGGALVSTPISIQGAWDVKKVLGTAKIYEDGSACFTVPARTPVYFQALDEKGQMVQSMRSWVTLQPGEQRACLGCHNSQNNSPPPIRASLAMEAGPQKLEPFYGPPRGFSFIKEIQPILDRHCVRCHNLDKPPSYSQVKTVAAVSEFNPKTMRALAPCDGAPWRYTFEEPAKGWAKELFDDSGWAYGPSGFGAGGAPGAKVGTAWRTSQIWIRRKFELPKDVRLGAPALLIHHDEDAQVYLNGRRAATAKGHTSKYVLLPIRGDAAATLRPGANTLAAVCRQTTGGQYIDVGIVDARPPAGVAAEKRLAQKPTPAADVKPAFSLKGTQTLDTRAQRAWSDAYKALANRSIANWINVQSAPPMLPPYSAGASQSPLIKMLEEGHYGVKLAKEELDRFIVWIDILVPYAGDYTEAMSEGGLPKYNRFLAKRQRWHAEEAANIKALLRSRELRIEN